MYLNQETIRLINGLSKFEHNGICDNLDEVAFSNIYHELAIRAAQEHETCYQVNVISLGITKSSGQYVGKWQRLLERWTERKIDNSHVINCLIYSYIPDDQIGVVFTPITYQKKRKPKTKIKQTYFM